MPHIAAVEDQIRELYTITRKEYEAFDRTLSALASLKFICSSITPIDSDTNSCDFRARIKPASADAQPYTPDAVVFQKRGYTFLVELKTSWNKSDVDQIVKYAKSPGRISDDGNVEPFGKHHCILLGYQNTPGHAELGALFSRFHETGVGFPLVLFRYSLEIGPDGNRLFFVRVPSEHNAFCPQCSLGKVFNSARGFSVSAASFKFIRASFHKANDRVIPSYAGIIWWTIYANAYLSDEQKAQMAERGRLDTPLVIPLDSLHKIPALPNVEVPFTAKDIKAGLEFLREARLVSLKRRKGCYEVTLKTDKRIRLPKTVPLLSEVVEQDVATKFITLYATYKVLKPIKEPSRKRRPGFLRSRARADNATGYLPFPK
jgi:hypothetical protein